ncbi:MAG: ornithine cyclodeaminase [Rhizobiaceae bacterium MnEN-MB40S]|nr:MAG: ornithine cyclodeaminase [Rhizobiaceae bacterium MnEN-MB40S]
MIVLSNEDVDKLFSMKTAIDVVQKVMIDVSDGKVNIPRRFTIDVGAPNRMGVMPGAMLTESEGGKRYFGMKMLSLYPENPKYGYSSHQGAMVLFDSEYGGAVAMMNADLLTAVRTAAASAVATQALAREKVSVLAIIGTGEQADHHIDAMLAVREFDVVHIAGRDFGKAEALAHRASLRHANASFVPGSDFERAIGEADVVCTVTASAEPFIATDWVKTSTHLNIVGSSIPSMREIHPELVARSALFVDYRDSTLTAAGEVMEAIEKGLIGEDHIRGEIGEVLSGKVEGRRTESEITLYRSLGIVAQDLAAAAWIYEQALSDGIGSKVTL